MKIIHVTYHLNINGVNSFLMNFLRHYDGSNKEVIFLTYLDGEYDYEDEVKSLGARIIRIDEPANRKRVQHIQQLKEVFENERPDVVHCHTYFDAANVMYAAKKAGVRVRVTHSHTTQRFKPIKQLLHKCVSANVIRRNSTHCLACSLDAGKALFGKGKFTVIPNGFDVSEFAYNEPARKIVRKEIGANEHDIIIGHTGKMRPEKNHLFMIDILRKLLAESDNYKLVFVGSGELCDRIIDRVHSYGLEKKVVLLNDRKDVSRILNAFDVFIMPSSYEGLSLSLVEAEINGLSAVISDTIPREAIIKKVTRLQVKNNADEWATTIRKLSLDREFPKKDRINYYSAKNMVKKIRAVYEDF